MGQYYYNITIVVQLVSLFCMDEPIVVNELPSVTVLIKKGSASGVDGEGDTPPNPAALFRSSESGSQGLMGNTAHFLLVVSCLKQLRVHDQ